MGSASSSPRLQVAGNSNSRRVRWLALLLVGAIGSVAFGMQACGWPQSQLSQARQLLAVAAAAADPPALAARLEPLRASPADLAVIGADRAACAAAPSAAQPLFRLHILDASSMLPSHWQGGSAASSTCNPESTSVWPHRLPWRCAQATVSMPHAAFQYAGGWWVARAAERSSAVQLVDSPDKADLILLDMHCVNARLYSRMLPNGLKKEEAPDAFDVPKRLLEHVAQLPRFRLRGGSDFVLVQTHPAHPGLGIFYSDQDPNQRICNSYLNCTLYFTAERSMLCPEGRHGELETLWPTWQGRAVLLPLVSVPEPCDGAASVSQRPILLFYKGGCARNIAGNGFSTGKRLREFLLRGITAAAEEASLGPSVQVNCGGGDDSRALRHEFTMQLLRESTFCLIVAGDTQSSSRLTEAVLSGCLPVFVGAPYHTLPLAGDVNWPAFSVFLRLNDTSPYIITNGTSPFSGQVVLRRWAPDMDLTGVEVEVDSPAAVLHHLRSISEQDVAQMQAALEHDRLKMLSTEEGQLGPLLVQKMCQRAAALKRLEGPRAGSSSH